MRFRYTYQKIVELKESEKKQAEWRLADSMGKLQNEERMLSQYEGQFQVLKDDLRQAAELTVKIAELQTMQGYAQHLEWQIARKSQDVAMAMEEVASKQQELLTRVQDEKVWSKAKEKAFIKFTNMLSKKEQNELDEIATNRFGRTIG